MAVTTIQGSSLGGGPGFASLLQNIPQGNEVFVRQCLCVCEKVLRFITMPSACRPCASCAIFVHK